MRGNVSTQRPETKRNSSPYYRKIIESKNQRIMKVNTPAGTAMIKAKTRAPQSRFLFPNISRSFLSLELANERIQKKTTKATSIGIASINTYGISHPMPRALLYDGVKVN